MTVGVELHSAVPDRGPRLICTLWILTSLACFTAILRIVARTRSRVFGWDDVFMIFSLICFFGWSVTLTLYAKRGGLQHITDVSKTGPDNVATVLFLNWLSQIFGIMGVAAGKISISALLLSIISLTELRWQRVFLWIVPITLAGLIAVACSTRTFAQCSPAEALWDQRVPGHCIKPYVMSSFGTFTGAFNTFADASLAIVPATIFRQLKSTTTEKTQLTIVFGLNILTSICSGIKTQYLAELANRTDQTWATYDIFAWVTGELFLMIVCGTIPTLHIVLSWFRRAAGGVQSAVSSAVSTTTTAQSSRKGGSGLRSEPDTDYENELSELCYMKVMTKTTIQGADVSRNESADWLGERGLPENCVRVEMMYDVRRDTRPNSAASGGNL